MIGVDLGLDLRREARARGREERVERDAFERVRARATGTAPRARRSAATLRLASAMRVLSTRAASWNVLHSSSRASRRSRSSKRSSSSSSSTSSRPGSSRRALSSTSVAAISRNSVALSRSTRSICSTSAQKTSTIRASEISQRSTSSLRIRCSRRSNGPSKTGVETSYGTRGQSTGRESQRMWYSQSPGQTSPAGILGRRMARVFSGIKPTGEMQLGNYLGAVRRWVDEQPPAGSTRRRAPRCDLLRRRPARA